jgi:hypothetical protein
MTAWQDRTTHCGQWSIAAAAAAAPLHVDACGIRLEVYLRAQIFKKKRSGCKRFFSASSAEFV